MRRARIALFLFLASSVYGADKNYQSAKLIDLQRYDTDAGAARSQGAFCLAIGLPDITYVVRQEAAWRWNYAPTDLIVGDPLEVRMNGNAMYIKKPKGGEFKTLISRRERNSPDKPPASCSIPVSTRN